MVHEKPGMVGHVYNPRTWKWKQEDHRLEACLGYIVTPYLKQTKTEITK
jgi:hypothetical protein